MLRLFFLLLFLSPFTLLNAEPQNSEKKSEQNLSRSEPRDSEFFFDQCYQMVPPVTRDTDKRPDQQIPVFINARQLNAKPNKVTYQDEVTLTQGGKFLSADKLTYLINEETAKGEGNVNFVNGNLTLYSQSIEAQLKSEQNRIYQAQYQFHGRGGRGNADLIYDNGQDVYQLNNSTYTACPPQDTTWSIESSTLYIDNEEGVGSAYNAILKIKEIPVFYLPYITYPLTDKRKTGLLFPKFKISGTNGFTVSQPLYLNITENMDATITPTYMQERGTLLAAEFRYLFDIGSGKIQTEYLSDDKIREEDRYLYHWEHNVTLTKNWHFSADYSKVSDDFYFSDIDTAYGSRSDNQLLQTAKLSYRESNWNSELEVRDFQILGGGNTPHKVMPKLAFNAYQPLNWRSLQFDFYSEISKFDHDESDVYTGTRVHLEPKLSLPLYYNSLFINTELKYMLSFYQQDIPETGKEEWYKDLEESTSRYIPSFKVHSGINFERDFEIFDSNYKQTLVPQIQYLYVPYQDQSSLGIYDTTTMQQDYYGLFRDNRFSGYDRIADANQITLGISSSFLNAQGQEKIRFALGQNYYFSQSKTQLPQNDLIADSASRSSLIGEFDINFDGEYFFHAGVEWDTDKNQLNRANSTFEKRWLYNTYAQLNYRYIAIPEESDWYLQADGLVNQLGSKVNWSINSQWSSFASYYYDLEYSHSYESIVGLKYQSCCWALGFTYDKHMLPYYGELSDIKNDYETEHSVSITFELMGLGGTGFSSTDKGLFDYGRPFYLQ